MDTGGYAHGFIVLSQTAEVIYKTTDYWVASDEDSIIWNDRDLGIDWPLKDIQGEPLLSGKDAAAKALFSLDLSRCQLAGGL